MARKPTYIRAWREEKGFTLDQMVGRLAELGVDTTAASLSRIERGKQPYSQDIIEAIAEALSVTMSHLTERNPKLPPAKIISILDHLNIQEVQRAEDVLRAMFGDRA
jgi:transcriptional regulator with XRE-family HTH domain